MGGGSADGAAVLKGLNELYCTGLSLQELCDIGVKTGADIPFCIVGGCGYCTGIGEEISPLPLLSGTVLIGKGSIGISTKEAFSAVDSKIFVHPITISRRYLQKPILPRYLNAAIMRSKQPPTLKKWRISKHHAANGALYSCMTGSGSAVFGIFQDETSADISKKILHSKGYFSEICSFIKG